MRPLNNQQDERHSFTNFIFTILIFFLCIDANAQEDRPYGFADKTIPELCQFEYYRGEWRTQIEMRQEDGSFRLLETVATVKGKFLEDHRTFQSQFTTADGFFSTDLRTFNTTTQEWNALFLNAKAQRWHRFTSKLINDKMTTIVKGGYSGKEAFDVKVVDTILSENHYLKEVYQSTDQMKNWDLTYKINVRKVQ